MTIGIIDIIGFILIFQLLIFSVFLFVGKGRYPSNYILGIQLISQGAGIFQGFCLNQYNFFQNNYPNLLYIGIPFMVLWGPTFYLYVRSAAFTDFKLESKYIIHFLPFLLLLVIFLSTFADPSIGILKKTSFDFFIFFRRYIDIFVRFQVLFYIFISIYTIYSVRKALMESYSSMARINLSWLKFLIFGFTAAYLLTIPIIIFWYITESFNPLLALCSILPYFIFFNIIFFRAWYQPEIFAGIEENKKYKSSKLTKDEAAEWMNKLEKYVSVNKPYLNPDLTLNQVAESIDIQPRILSQIINEYFNQNFYDYINRLRIEESKEMLSDSIEKKTILEILYSTGFNSKSAFNYAFKKYTGSTPTEFRKRTIKEIASNG